MSLASHISASEARRWVISAAVVLSLHAGATAAVVRWSDPITEIDDASGLVVLELADETTTAATADAALPPGPLQIQADAAPPPPDTPREQPPEETRPDVANAEPEPEAQPEPPVVETAEVSLPTPAFALPPEPPVVEAPPPAPETTAPQVLDAPAAALTAAASASSLNTRAIHVPPQWSRRIAVLLERNKRYPASARARREEGVARVAFVIDRRGMLLSSHILKSSGVAALDQEALELLRRAQPFPPLPASVAGEELKLMVPIKFELR
jgi:periplasmic protein TonB